LHHFIIYNFIKHPNACTDGMGKICRRDFCVAHFKIQNLTVSFSKGKSCYETSGV